MEKAREFLSGLTLRPQGVTLVFAVFLPTLAIMAMFPIIANMIEHFRSEPGAAQRVPAMITAPGYAVALLAPIAGLLTDRIGRRRILLSCTFAYGIVGAAPFLLDDLDAIFVSRLLLGICEAGILTGTTTLIADYWDDRGRRNWLFLQGLIGPALQPLAFFLVSMGTLVRWNGGFLVYLVAIPVFVAMCLFIHEPARQQSAAPQHTGPAQAAPFPYGTMALVALLTLFVSIIFFVPIIFGSVLWAGIGVSSPLDVSKYTSVPVLFVLVGAALFRYCSRFRIAVQMGIVFFLFAVGLAGMALAQTVPAMQVSFAIAQTAGGMTFPVFVAWAQSMFAFEHRGRGMGGWTSAFFLGQAVSPLVTGPLARVAGSMQEAFLMVGAMALAAAVVAAMMAQARRA